MTKKLLQKTSNKYLQLHPPENLLPAKSLGRKRGRYCGKGGMSLGQYSQMENGLRNQWAFSWNALHRRVNSQPLSPAPMNGVQPTPPQWCTTTLPPSHLPPRGVDNSLPAARGEGGGRQVHPLIPPTPWGCDGHLESAVGGGLIDHLNRALQGGLPPVGPGKTYGPGRGGGDSVEMKGGQQGGGAEKGIFRFSHRGGPLYHLMDVVDCVSRQIQSHHWTQIYDPQEIHRAMRSRDRIGDDYRNQLAECRKIAILYGNLPRKTLFRGMQLARKQGGNADSAFLSALERRLDVALKRCLFFPTIRSARQWICQGKIRVNNQPVSICSYQLQPGDHIAIAAGERENWRNQCFRSLASPSADGRARDGVSPVAGADRDVNPSLSRKPLPTALHMPPADHVPARRFPLSPPFLRKWKRWSLLWGNEEGATGGRTHSWESPAGLGGVLVNGVDISSSFAGTSGLHQALVDDLLGKARTNIDRIHRNVQAVGKNRATITPPRGDGAPSGVYNASGFVHRVMESVGAAHREGGGGAVAGIALRRESGVTKWLHFSPSQAGGWLSRGPLEGGKAAPQGVKTRATPPLFQKHGALDRQWLHHQQRAVVDGLYHIRSNRVYAERKSPARERSHWRWSCLKPLHFECNYKQCTAIFLYPPQKLAWPSSINCSLLRKTLV